MKPDQIAIIDEQESITYQDWNERVQRSAQWLQETAHQQKRIAFLLSNGASFLQIFAGAACAGWTAVPLDPRWSHEECVEKLLLSEADLAIIEDRLMKRFEQSSVDIPIISLSEWKERMSLLTDSPCSKSDTEKDPVFYMGFTSGSTGSPKAFIRRQQSWIESFQMTTTSFGITHQDHVLILGTLLSSHFLYGAISTLYFGGTVTLLEKFVPGKAKKALETGDITVMYTVPTMTETLLQIDAFGGDSPLLVMSSGADWSISSKEQLVTNYPHVTFFDFYGTSELSFVSYLSSNDFLQKPSSVGRPFSSIQVEVRHPDQSVCQPNETGRIYVKSPMTFSGYLHEEKPPQEWLTVYDMGWLDEDGYLYMSGRENGMIVYGGLNIFPEEIERVLNEQPEVKRSIVVGVPDPYWGEIPVAILEQVPQIKAVRQAVKEKLAAYKVPKKWLVIDQMMETSGGKIARASMKRWAEEQLSCKQ
ncbi:acyl-CoA synthetase [Bacillus safensis]|uniref:acyl-CoA synthetase n=1 Tax=Bacillus safensis TaxID=561879 RepID=UPI00065234B1|nr:acyl-CoA synthetase [Bacillus safensis]KML13675.1 acyl-CoA synthetase [Bacillus safensis]KML51000.1 acyl-CoA synthetase [Bacillus safensis]KMN78912.1 acyl-CoA synthetase [Bacillus safensis]